MKYKYTISALVLLLAAFSKVDGAEHVEAEHHYLRTENQTTTEEQTTTENQKTSSKQKPLKFDICHVPPDNPFNFMTLSVSENAWPDHEGHGDFPGICEESCPQLCVGVFGDPPAVTNADHVLDCVQRCSDKALALLAATNDADLSVLECDADSLVVEGALANELLPGTYLVLAGEDGMLCSNCAPLFRNIIGVENGTVPDSKILTTTFATFAEIYDTGNYDESLADVEIEPIFDCAHSDGRRLSSEHDSRSLQPPADCSVWHDVDSSGQCSHTDCFVGAGGDVNHCFECGAMNECSDGCAGTGMTGDFGLFDISEACCNHDHCCLSTFSRVDCDDTFYWEMNDACPLSDQSEFFIAPVDPLNFGLSPSKTCNLMALLFSAIVKSPFGTTLYDAGRARQQAQELAEVCNAPVVGDVPVCHRRNVGTLPAMFDPLWVTEELYNQEHAAHTDDYVMFDASTKTPLQGGCDAYAKIYQDLCPPPPDVPLPQHLPPGGPSPSCDGYCCGNWGSGGPCPISWQNSWRRAWPAAIVPACDGKVMPDECQVVLERYEDLSKGSRWTNVNCSVSEGFWKFPSISCWTWNDATNEIRVGVNTRVQLCEHAPCRGVKTYERTETSGPDTLKRTLGHFGGLSELIVECL